MIEKCEYPESEQGVDKRRHSRRSTDNYDNSQQQQDDNHRYQPKLFTAQQEVQNVFHSRKYIEN